MAYTKQQIDEIERGRSFVKVLPVKIGKLVFFETTEPTESAPKTRSQYLTNKALTIFNMVLIFGLLGYMVYYFRNVDSSWPWIVAFFGGAITFFVGMAIIGNQSFSGTDYFIGTKGFASYSFKNDRTNIVSRTETLFEEFNYILHKEVANYKDGVYQGTNYLITMVSSYNHQNRIIAQIKGGYDEENNQDKQYAYLQEIEDICKENFAENVKEELQRNGFVRFPVYTDNHEDYSHDILIYPNGSIKIYNQQITPGDIDDIYTHEGKMTIKYRVHSEKKTQKETIPFGSVGNVHILLILLRNFYKIGKL